jgi:hypothetical protein
MRAARELQRHFANLRNANHGQYGADLKILHGFLLSTPVFRAVIEHIKGSLFSGALPLIRLAAAS